MNIYLYLKFSALTLIIVYTVHRYCMWAGEPYFVPMCTTTSKNKQHSFGNGKFFYIFFLILKKYRVSHFLYPPVRSAVLCLRRWRRSPTSTPPSPPSSSSHSPSPAQVLCASHCFPIFNVFIDWRSSYHVHKNLSTCLLDRKIMRGPPYEAKHILYRLIMKTNNDL